MEADHVPTAEDAATQLDLPWQPSASAAAHPWVAVRDGALSLLAVALALNPDALSEPGFLEMAGRLDYRGVQTAIEAAADGPRPVVRVHDFCAGAGTLSAAAAALGCSVTAVELEPVAGLINQVVHSYSADTSISEPDDAQGWHGLYTEIAEAADALLGDINAQLGLQSDRSRTLLGRIWARCSRCTHCGAYMPIIKDPRVTPELRIEITYNDDLLPVSTLVQSTDADAGRTWHRASPRCGNCGTTSRATPADATAAVPLVDVVHDGDQWDAQPATDVYALDFTDELKSVGSHPITDPRTIWSWNAPSQKPIHVGFALLPSQRRYLEVALTSIEHRFAPDGTHGSLRSQAVAAALVLSLSALLPHICTFTGWDYRRKMPSSARRRHGWPYVGTFFDPTPATAERQWRANVTHLLQSVKASRAHLRRPVAVLIADAGQTGLPEASADVVLWDPPVYDWIDFRGMAHPHEVLLASVSNLLPPEVAAALDRPSRDDGPPSRFNRAQYEAGLATQAREARRVLTDGGRLAVFWPAGERTKLQDFLTIVAPAGFELAQAIRVSRRELARTYVLLLIPTPRSPQNRLEVDAERVLELADGNRPALNHGLAEILIRRLDADEVDAMLPYTMRGSRLNRLAEFVASDRDPARFLIELGRSDLRAELGERDIDINQLALKDSRHLANAVLVVLGFHVPEPSGVSIKARLQEAEQAASRLEYAHTEVDTRGSATTCFIELERVLRYSVLAWSLTPAAPANVLTSTMEKHGRNWGPRMTFGDWKLLFTEVPKEIRDASGDPDGVFITIARKMRRVQMDDKLSQLISLRNAVQHDGSGVAVGDFPERIATMTATIRAAIDALADLDKERLLPITVDPLEEIRDRFGRRRLVLEDADGGRIEVHVDHETDLSKPLCYVWSGSNPRDVSPMLIPARHVESLLDSSE